MLLGPAGAGKTAIVEGLAIRHRERARCPSALRDMRLFDVPLLSLAAGTRRRTARCCGDFLLEARHPSVVVFFDEIHLLAVAGGPATSRRRSSRRSPAARSRASARRRARSTRRAIEPETALARRFTPDRRSSPWTRRPVRAVLVGRARQPREARGVTVGDEALDELVALADQFLPNRSFPDKGVDLHRAVGRLRHHPRADDGRRRDAPARRSRRWSGCRSTRPRRSRRWRRICATERCSSPAPRRALAASACRCAASTRTAERPDAVVLLFDGARGRAPTPSPRLAGRDLFGRDTARDRHRSRAA